MNHRTLAITVLLSFALAPLAGASPSRAAEDGGTRLLRQPDVGATQLVFTYGGDVWIVDRDGGEARRLTATPAVESDPHLSPDGTQVAFTSNRAGRPAVWTMPAAGGMARRLTWYPSNDRVRGWSPDGTRVLYSSERQTAPVGYNRLWTVPLDGGPSTRLPVPWGEDAEFGPDGRRLIVDPVSRWDEEWRHYRGGQNTPLRILDLETLEETPLPFENSYDLQPVWTGGKIWFLSDRDWTTNVWSYDPATGALAQATRFEGADVKWLTGHDDLLVFEREGRLQRLDPATGATRRIEIEVRGDFPWAQTAWEDVSGAIRNNALSPTGQRALFEARGEIFTVPADKGDVRNLTRSAGAADREPVWSPEGDEIAWFSDAGEGYALLVAPQDGLGEPRRISIGDSKMAWEATWSPDGKRIAFVDDDVRVRVVELATGAIVTADTGGVNIERGGMGPTWSPDSRWLAYSKTFPNMLRRVTVWSVETGEARALTGPLADAGDVAWDRGGKLLYFLASTDVALGSGWANTSRIGADPSYGVYAALLPGDATTPFVPESDEEPVEEAKDGRDGKDGKDDEDGDGGKDGKRKKGDKGEGGEKEEPVEVRIDFDGIQSRIVALPMPVGRYRVTHQGPAGTVFVAEYPPGEPGATLHRFSLEEREAEPFLSGVDSVRVSADGKKLLYRQQGTWRIVGTEGKPSGKEEPLRAALSMRLDRREEWRQIFDEAWRYERDFFYDPGLHGRDWDAVRERYAPLVPHVRHRDDLNYVLNQLNGELSVGHSFVFGGDMPDVEDSRVGLLGADLEIDSGRWRIARIFTFESWNPDLQAPLARPGIEVAAGDYVLAVDGVELTAADDPYRLLDGTEGRQTVLHVNDAPTMEGARTIVVEPVGSEYALRQRAWVEDNRRRVDALSDGRLAYVWVPNTGSPGVVSFNRYFFAQQDREGAVIDERYNQGGLLDDYMVDLMTRELRAAITNEAPGGAPFRLPAGILGPKVLLINEMAGSGGDYFPWVFRRLGIGPLIGKRTWGGLVKSSVHYPLVDGGALTAPDNAVFDPLAGEFIGENRGIAPDIEVAQDARSVEEGRDPQLERAVTELLRILERAPRPDVERPPYPRPTKRD